MVVLIALAVLPLLTPPFTHAALDAAGSARRLGTDAATAHDLSDRSVQELVTGPGTFVFEGPDGGPFYDGAERGHLADARTLLWLWLVAGSVAALLIAMLLARAPRDRRTDLWRTASRAGASTAIAVVALGALAVVAFEPLFELFHRVFFPAGNFSFDPTTQRLVQLYPLGFWQIAAAALGGLVFLLGLGAWLLGRVMAGRVRHGTPDRPAPLVERG